MRVKPRRETRGVSRSKCGDLITATVPVTWAASIIVSETTDAIDYYDGFGTTELVVGVRAYQWGWEYYYPKDIDLNYNIKQNYSTFVGNSLKYNQTSMTNLSSNNLWKFYQNKVSDSVITPAHLLVLPLDNFKTLNFLNFNDIGINTLNEANSFKKIKMFSKTFTSNLLFIPNDYSNKYKIFSNLFINDNIYVDSYLYGLKRQHNFLSTKSILNNNSTFFSLKSVNKFLNFNFKFNKSSSYSFNNQTFLNLFQKNNNSGLVSSSQKLNTFFNKFSFNTSLKLFSNYSLNTNALSLINDNSDKKDISYPMYKIFNKSTHNVNFVKSNELNNLNNSNDILNLNNVNETDSFFFNSTKNMTAVSNFAQNESILISNKTTKNFSQLNSKLSHTNFSLNLNSTNESFIALNNSNKNNLEYFYNLKNLNWLNLNTFSKISNNKLSFDYPYSPVPSNSLNTNTLNYDSLDNTFIPSIPTLLQGKEDSMPNFLPNAYWSLYWSNANSDLRLSNVNNYFSLQSFFYLPMFNFYYDYDFRNWQAIELLEDSFWESIYSIYTYDEYLALLNEFNNEESLNKNLSNYIKYDKNISEQVQVLNKQYFKDKTSVGDFYINTFYLDDLISPSSLLNTNNFNIFPIFSSLSVLDDSYESIKNLNFYYFLNNKIFLNLGSNFFNPYSYSQVSDMFRSDFEDFSFSYDENNFTKFKLNDYFNPNSALLESDVNLNKLLRFNNNINLRNTIKSSIVTYNATQKIFRSRFDENRSNTKLSDFSNFYVKQPFISSPRVSYETLLGKTKENFYKINFYKNKFNIFFNNFYDLNTSLNYYFYDFPFLLAFKSDSSRYFWFDWFSKWGFYEVQPSSASRYALYGMPYFSKNFEFSTSNNETLTDSETYLLRIARARKNYMPNWVYTPYLYNKTNNWNKNNQLFNLINDSNTSLINTLIFLNQMHWYWTSITFLNFSSSMFTPSSSGINSYSKVNWQPKSSIQSYYYNTSHLIDILTKREYLYREFFINNNKIINLPYYLTSNPSNPLINEIKSTFLFIDPILYNNEYSRNIYFNSLSYFNFITLNYFFNSLSNSVNLNFLNNFIFFYFFNNSNKDYNSNNYDLYRNQYKPLKKGISNMLRLHATGAVAMPTEIRLQILASSKDVIHSWAIPSAGIKIDCVPGYSSHRVMIFLLSGIFWGQCMEICGRYHHWMPIVVYFMKRDLFFLWCTHFVFLSGSNNFFNINDKQYTNYVRVASFDKNNWLTELNS
jgi:hypothetical protein